MLKKLIAGVLSILVIAFSWAAFAAEAKDKEGPVKEQLAQTEAASSNHDPMSFVFYLDAESRADYEEQVRDEIIKAIQEKMPLYAIIKPNGKFETDFDLFRVEKYDQFVKEMKKSNPGFTVAEGYSESSKMIRLSKEIVEEYLKKTDYDGVVTVHVDKIEERTTINANAMPFGIGALKTKVEMSVVIRVFNKKSPNGYVFNNKQRIIGKGSGSWSPATASRKVIPIAMKNIKAITVE